MASLYFHIPFCRKICGYCDFYKQVCRGEAPEEYLAAIVREMEASVGFLEGQSIDTVYFGGGTPSLYSPMQLSRLIDRANGLWHFGNDVEITLEANPDDVTPDFIGSLKDSRFNRLSIGVQSFEDLALKFMNRRHDSLQAVAAIESAQKAGIDNISIDLIYGIPGFGYGELNTSIDITLSLGIQHISAYHLTIEPNTAFGVKALKNKLRPVEEGVSESEYALLRERLTNAGFIQYEISNFAFGDSFRSRHNSAYWSGMPYLGLGASAHSYDGQNIRRIVIANADIYTARAGSDEIYEIERLSEDDLYNEFIMVSLRTSRGFSVDELLDRFATRYADHFFAASEKYIESGHLVQSGGTISIPPEHFLVSDAIIEDLFFVQ